MDNQKRIVRLDNRGLAPPEPMMRILATIEDFDRDTILVANMDREPIFLFAELHDRGFAYSCDPEIGGGYLLKVYRE